MKEMVDNQEVLTNKSPTMKLRSDILRKIKESTIQESNEFLAKRINSKYLYNYLDTPLLIINILETAIIDINII
jgi:hypothetical protein